MLQNCITVAGLGLQLTKMEESERTVKQGDTAHYMTAIYQVGELFTGLSIVNAACELAKRVSPIRGFSSILLLLSPIITVIAAARLDPKKKALAKSENEQERLKAEREKWKVTLDKTTWYGKVFYVIHDNIGNLTFVASVVSSVAMIYFGATAVGVCCLVSLGYGLASRARLIPHCVRMKLEPVRRILQISSLFLVGGWIGPITAVSEGISFALDTYFTLKNKTVQQTMAGFLKTHGSWLGLKTIVGMAYVMKGFMWLSAKMSGEYTAYEKICEFCKDIKTDEGRRKFFDSCSESILSMRRGLGFRDHVNPPEIINDFFDFQERKSEPTILTPDLIDVVLSEEDPLALVEIDYSHMNDLSIAAPDIDYEKSLTELFKTFENQKNFKETLKEKLKDDDKWIKRDQGKFSNEFEYAYNNLAEMLSNVKNRSIKHGEVDANSYDILENHLKMIAYKLVNCKDTVQKQDVLLRLAIEAGQYCVNGIVDTIENESFLLQFGEQGEEENIQEISPRDKILLSLLGKRRGLAQRVYHLLTRENTVDYDENLSECETKLLQAAQWAKTGKIAEFLGKEDRHTYNTILSAINAHETLGLNSISAKDSLLKKTSVQQINNYFTKQNFSLLILFYALYRENYHPKKMLKTLREEIKTGSKTLDTGALSKYLVEDLFGKLPGINNETNLSSEESVEFDCYKVNVEIINIEKQIVDVEFKNKTSKVEIEEESCKKVKSEKQSSKMDMEKETYKDRISDYIGQKVVTRDLKSGEISISKNYFVVMLIQMGIFKLHPLVVKKAAEKEQKLSTAELIEKIAPASIDDDL